MTMPDQDDDRVSRRQRIVGLSAFAAIFGISIASIFGGELLQSSEAERNRAPKLDLAQLSGASIQLEPKNPTVLRFVDADCATCMDDLVLLDRSRRRWEGKVNYVVVVAAASPETVREGFAAADESIQVGLDPDDKTATAYGIDDLPATVFVTADGQILERDTGPLAAEHLERRIRSVIAEGPD